MRQQWFSRGWKLLVSIALLAILVWTQDLSDVFQLIRHAHSGWLVLSTLLMLIEQTITAVTWGILLAARRLKVPMLELINIYYMSSFIGTWLPSSTGPDVLRAYYLARYVDGYDAVGSMLVLRFISLLGLGLFAVAGIYLVPSELPPEALLLAWFLVAAGAGALFVGFTERPRRWATAVLEAIGLRRVAAILGKLHGALHAYRKSPGALLVAMFLSMVVQFLRIVTIYYAALALGAGVPFLHYLVLVPVTILISLIPISLAGLGVREGAFVYFFSRVGMSESMAFSLSLLMFGLTLVLWVIGAALYWRDRPAAGTASARSS
ncbi:MAG: flippase-like domain-containing protein [Acidobacteria bacterium]|nr:flippase-like domain-containing protein [Acidobacteriota bacterium]